MKQIRAQLGVIQNVGWLDRMVRVVVGIAMLAYPAYMILTSETEHSPWLLYSMLFSVYPWLTGIVGFDPVYAQFVIRTCDTSDRNPCGTFPFEIDAALGRHPIPNSDVEHSLESSRH
ncbi:MAG: DUF2892 domain-containing protein [Gammaproteobacteria bacterium]|nr:DUF2892 domain-containing protein [Gammaproteobacteria bacterium]